MNGKPSCSAPSMKAALRSGSIARSPIRNNVPPKAARPRPPRASGRSTGRSR